MLESAPSGLGGRLQAVELLMVATQSSGCLAYYTCIQLPNHSVTILISAHTLILTQPLDPLHLQIHFTVPSYYMMTSFIT